MNIRLTYLDGLRGLLALVVVLEHFFKVFYPVAHIDSVTAPANASLGYWLTMPPFTFLHNGAWAVSAFFVLSAFVLCRSLESKNVGIIGAVEFLVQRYLRLAVPVFFSLLFVYLIVQVGWDVLGEWHSSNNTHLKGLEGDGISLVSVFSQGFYGAIFTYDYSHNLVLWTITVEMFGSAFVLLYMVLSQRIHIDGVNQHILTLVLLAVFLYATQGSFMQLFVYGIVLYEAIKVEHYLHRSLDVLLIIIGAILMSVWARGSFNNPFMLFTLTVEEIGYEYFYNGVGSALMLWCVIRSRLLQNLLSPAYIKWLGNVSYSLYLTHFVILGTVGVWLVKICREHNVQDYVPFTLTILVIFVFAYLFNPLTTFYTKIYNILKSCLIRLRTMLSNTAQAKESRS